MPSVKPDLRQQTVPAGQLARYLCCLTRGRLSVRVDKQLGAAGAESGELTEPIAYAIGYLAPENGAGGTRQTWAAAPSRASRPSLLHRICAGYVAAGQRR